MDKIDRLLNASGVEDEITAQPQQQTSMDASGEYTVSAPAPEPAELTGEVGRQMQELVARRRSTAMQLYVSTVKRMAGGGKLGADEAVELSDAMRALRYSPGRVDEDIAVVRRYNQCREVVREHASLVKEASAASAGVEKHYQKVLAVIAEQKRLADALDAVKGRRDWLAGKLADAETLKAQHAELLT